PSIEISSITLRWTTLTLVPITRGNSLFDGYSNHVPGRVIRCRRAKSSENRSIRRVAHLNGNWQQMQLRMGVKALPPLVNHGGRRQEPTYGNLL
ncbi:hypothetical protein CDAR_452891, partial [Caerostris darwini]